MQLFHKDKLKPGQILTELDYEKASNIAIIVVVGVYLNFVLKIFNGIFLIVPLYLMSFVFKFIERSQKSKKKTTMLKSNIAKYGAFLFWILNLIGLIILLFGLYQTMRGVRG